MKVPLHAAYAWLTILVCGCGAQTLDAGSNTDAGAVAPPSGVRWSAWPPSNDFNDMCSPDGSTPLVGSWLGHFDNYVFPSGSNEIRLDLIDTNPTDVPTPPCGNVVFGGGDPPPLPTDPTAYCPPGSDPVTPIGVFADGGIGATIPFQRTVYEGFRYDFTGVTQSSFSDGHVQIGITTRQLYKAWCEMQLSYFQTQSSLVQYGYDCVPPNTDWWQVLDGGGASFGSPATRGRTSCRSAARRSCCATLAPAGRTDAPSPATPTFTWTSSFKVTPGRATCRFRGTGSRPSSSNARHERDAPSSRGSHACFGIRRTSTRALTAARAASSSWPRASSSSSIADAWAKPI